MKKRRSLSFNEVSYMEAPTTTKGTDIPQQREYNENSAHRTMSSGASIATNTKDLSSVQIYDDEATLAQKKTFLLAFTNDEENKRKTQMDKPIQTTKKTDLQVIPYQDENKHKTLSNGSTTTAMKTDLSTFPYYEDYWHRLQSFDDLPQHTIIKPGQFAEAGFFYIGDHDHVTCYSCGLKLKDWKLNEDPWIEHCSWNPRCQYVEDQKRRIKQISRFGKFEDRLSTFTKQWPGIKEQSPVHMAKAGFYYLGYGDHVRCYECDVHLHRWEPGDKPHEEHLRWQPECRFFNQTGKPKSLVDKCRHAERSDMCDEFPNTSDNTPTVDQFEAIAAATTIYDMWDNHNTRGNHTDDERYWNGGDTISLMQKNRKRKTKRYEEYTF